MYREAAGKKLYLRREVPDRDDIARFRSILKTAGAIGNDRDYGSRVIRVLSVSDLPAEDVVCLVDPTCYVSHLSAMQRWGLTDRTPRALALTRPDRKAAAAVLRTYMNEAMNEKENNPYSLTLVNHPSRVRRRNVTMYESRAAGAFMTNRGTDIRLSTVGQTFLDTAPEAGLVRRHVSCPGCLGRACFHVPRRNRLDYRSDDQGAHQEPGRVHTRRAFGPASSMRRTLESTGATGRQPKAGSYS